MASLDSPKVTSAQFFKKNYSKVELQARVELCRGCHRGLHKLYDEMTLGKNFNTLDKLRADTDVMKHVAWVSKQKVSV